MHIKPKDIVEFLLIGILVVALIFLAGFLETAPLGITMWVAVFLAVLLWIAWGVLVILQRREEDKPLVTMPELWVSNGKEWVSMSDPTKKRPFVSRADSRRAATIFDQEEATE